MIHVDLSEDNNNYSLPRIIDLLDEGVVLLPERHLAPVLSLAAAGRELEFYSVVDIQS